MKYKSPLIFRTAIFVTLFLSFHSLSAIAQTWQWGKRGGGSMDGPNVTPTETVIDMATDKNANIYVLALVIHAGGSADIDGHAIATKTDRNILITKFGCNGAYKWHKVIKGGNPSFASIGVDTLGHVYVAGKNIPGTAPDNVEIDTDTTQPAGNEKTLFLVQYDTLGNFKWLREPNPDTATYLSTFTCQSYDMKVTPDGDVYWLVKLHEGLVSGSSGWATTGKHPYILQYNSSGTLVSHIQMQMETDVAAFHNIGLERTVNGKFIIAGGQDYYAGISNFTMGGKLITHSLFVGMFNAAGQLIWKQENNINAINSRVSGRPLSDASSNIYLTGTISNTDTFNTYKHINTLQPTLPFSSDMYVCKLDSAGKMIWIKAASGNGPSYRSSIAFKSVNELWVCGDYTWMEWDSKHVLNTQYNNGTHFGITRFNSFGKILDIDSLKGPTGLAIPINNYFHACASDNKGNVFIGGEFPATITGPNISLASHGGTTDLIFAKLGYNCNCTTPVSSFNSSISGTTLTLSYTGPATGIDSVVWDYGDGTSAKKTSGFSTPFTYTYASKGAYTLCATVYSTCGSDQSCKGLTLFNVGTGMIAAQQNVKVYPNPAGSYINIEGADKETTAAIYNLVGQCISGSVKINGNMSIPLTDMSKGTYLLVLTNENGVKSSFSFIKQ